MDNDNNNLDEKIIDVNIESEMKKSYIDYAMSVIVARALPDVRDGLKPVHRRILYAMNELGLDPDKPYRKSARIVGDVLGKYHPHGDAAVYDSMVRMAQDFSLRYTLVDGHGNFGSVDGDSPAAMRYTEAKMEKLTTEMLRDIEKDTVNFVANFDDTLKEPDVLPARIPCLLVNGSSGIAVGMATNFPPHNLGEVIDGIVKVIDDDNVTIDDLMQIIKGPDFPTGGIIMGLEGVKNAYHTGRGRIIVRSRAEIETIGAKQRIVVTEIPYMVNKARLIENIANLVKAKRIEGISDLRDESDREGMRIVIELKRDANANVVLNQLYKNTQMQDTFGAIMLALVDKTPQTLNLRQCIDYYLEHQKEVILRRTQFDLTKAEARLHILEGLKIAIDNIDEVIKIIRAAYDDAKERLMARFGLSETQAQAILDMRLKTLSGLQREKIEAEYNELLERIKYYKEILSSETLVFQIIREELLALKEKFADPRRTAIEPVAGEEINIESLIKEENCVITLTHFGYIKRLPSDTYKSQKRGGKGITGLTTREEDFVENIFTSSTHHYIMFFTNKGKTYRLKAYEVPEASRQAKGTAIVNLLQLDSDEQITAVIPVAEYCDEAYLLMATRNGVIKKTKLTEYSNVRKGGLLAITLKENDELIDVRLTDGTNKVVMVTHEGQSITFDEKDVRPIGRTSQGVRGIELNHDDFVIGMEPIISDEGYLFTVSENGFGKRTELSEYRIQSRGGKGVLTYKVTNKTGALVGIKIVNEIDDVILISSDGTIIRLAVNDVSILSRNTQGVTLMRMPDKTNIVSIAKVVGEEDTE